MAFLARHPSYAKAAVAFHLGRALARPASWHGLWLTRMPYRRFSQWVGLVECISEDEACFLSQIKQRAGIVLDIGANVGAVSLVLSRGTGESLVFASEPSPEVHRALLENLRLNQANKIIPLNIAFADKPGERLFSPSSTTSPLLGRLAGPEESGIPVAVESVDEFCAKRQLDRISFLKIDVEGHEEDVLEGSKGMLRERRIDVVYYEVCPRNCREIGRDPLGATRLLQTVGYEVFTIGRGGKLHRLVDLVIPENLLANWVALPVGHREGLSCTNSQPLETR